MQPKEGNTKKRSSPGQENTDDRKKMKQNKYGDGVSWCRGAMIGKGSFGDVFLATLKKSSSTYSPFPPLMAVKSADISVSGSVQKEMQVFNNIPWCPDVIECYGEETTYGEKGQMVYNLLLEYGSGGTLADLIKNSGGHGLPELDVRRHTRSIVRGLCHIHKCGYVHCDLKPQNILLVANNKREGFKAKIGDFGLAKRANQSRKSRLGPYLRGTPMYLSPEAVINGVQETPSDVWAVGCIVWEMLTGKAPWYSQHDSDREEIMNRIKDEKGSPCIPASNISTEGRNFLKRCLSRNARVRLTAEKLLEEPFLQGLVEEMNDYEEEDTEGSSYIFEVDEILSWLEGEEASSQ